MVWANGMRGPPVHLFIVSTRTVVVCPYVCDLLFLLSIKSDTGKSKYHWNNSIPGICLSIIKKNISCANKC